MFRDSSLSIAQWCFSLKYLKSCLQMPALFGGKPVSEGTTKCIKYWNYVMLSLSVLLPVVCYGLIGVAKFKLGSGSTSQNDGSNHTTYVWTYIVLTLIVAMINLVIASVLIYAVVKIRLIIGKFGLSQRVNYRMFVVNAFGMAMYVVATTMWAIFFFDYARINYN